MDALQPLRIEKTSRIADDQSAVHVRARHRIPASVWQRLRAVAHQFSALENFLQEWMRLPNLKSGVRIEQRIGIFQCEHQTDGEPVVRQPVNPPSAVHVRGNRPAQRMRHVARREAPRLHVPQFLDPDPVALRVDVVELFLFYEFFCQRSARTLRQHRHLRAQFVARSEVGFRLAVLVEAFVFGDDAADAIAFVGRFAAAIRKDELRAAEFLEDVDASGLDQPAEPLDELIEGDDVIALVLEGRRRNRKAEGRIFREQQCRIIRNGRIQRRALLKTRHQLRQRPRIHDRTGKLVRPDLAPFFENVDVFSGELRLAAGVVVLLDQIRQMQRTSQSRRPRANDQHIRFKLFSLNGHGFAFIVAKCPRFKWKEASKFLISPRLRPWRSGAAKILSFSRDFQFPVGMIPTFSTMRITVLCGARVRCRTPLGTTVPCLGPSSIVRPSRSINSFPSST